MAEFSTVRAAVKTRLANITALQLHNYRPDSITPPAAAVEPAPGIFIKYDTSTSSNDYFFLVTLWVPRAVDSAGQNELDSYLTDSGANSIRAAINGEDIGDAHYMVCEDARNFREDPFGTEIYYACDFYVSVGV